MAQGDWRCPRCQQGLEPLPRQQPITNRELLLAGALGLVRIDSLRAVGDGQATWQGCVFLMPEETERGRQVRHSGGRPSTL